jgi:PAS domain S-box-containing protein
MKNHQSSHSVTGTIQHDPTLFNEPAVHGNHELVNFPSTGEVFHAVFENSIYASCIGNCHGKPLEVNETVCKIFGYSEKEMVGLSAGDVLDTREPAYAEYLAERQATGKATAEVTGIRKNGERFPCKISSVVFIDDNGEARTINTIHDISKKGIDILPPHHIVY